MFKVVCINDSPQIIKEVVPFVKKGNIYTVIDVVFSKREKVSKKYPNIVCEEGDYYVLAECGSDTGYHSSLFIKINETEIDETEFEREFQTEKQTA